jgi:hypothetical protein
LKHSLNEKVTKKEMAFLVTENEKVTDRLPKILKKVTEFRDFVKEVELWHETGDHFRCYIAARCIEVHAEKRSYIICLCLSVGTRLGKNRIKTPK